MKYNLFPESVRKLFDVLEKIGWKVEHRGCGMWGLINPDGNKTEAWFFERRTDMIIQEEIFGRYRGTFSIDLERCTIEEKERMVTIHLKMQRNRNQKNMMFFSFYGKM